LDPQDVGERFRRVWLEQEIEFSAGQQHERGMQVRRRGAVADEVGEREIPQGRGIGRGLPVVAALARAWGVIGDSTGRTVWAEIPYPMDDMMAEFYGDNVVNVGGEPTLRVIDQPATNGPQTLHGSRTVAAPLS